MELGRRCLRIAFGETNTDKPQAAHYQSSTNEHVHNASFAASC
jgi:hypothetical protein